MKMITKNCPIFAPVAPAFQVGLLQVQLFNAWNGNFGSREVFSRSIWARAKANESQRASYMALEIASSESI